MAANYYLRLDGIRGASKAAHHLGEIDIPTFSFGIGTFSQNVRRPIAGKISNISEIHFTKNYDISSASLFNFYIQGRMIGNAKLTAEEILPGGKIKKIMSLEMEEVMITYIQPGQVEQVVLAVTIKSVSYN